MNLEEAKEFGAIYHHKFIVAEALSTFVKDLVRRLVDHDKSKFNEDEFPDAVKSSGEIRSTTYGTPEYDAMREKYMHLYAIHYKQNRHHPEFFENGILGMNLVDILEMVADWKAASMRSGGSMENSVRIATEKFKISPDLVKILENTIRDYKL
jgi:hypothetical protein